MLVKEGDVLTCSRRIKEKWIIPGFAERAEKTNCALWIERDLKNLSGRILRVPERGEIDGNLNEQLIVEYYSR